MCKFVVDILWFSYCFCSLVVVVLVLGILKYFVAHFWHILWHIFDTFALTEVRNTLKQ